VNPLVGFGIFECSRRRAAAKLRGMPLPLDGSEVSLLSAVEKEVSQRESIGVIGLGLMGSAMGGRLLAHGFPVLGFDINSGCLAACVARGGRAATSVTELVASCGRIILSLPDSEMVRMVLDELHLDLEQTLVVLRDSMAYSRAMDTKGDKMIAGYFEPQARLSQHLKDVRLIQSAAELSHARIPLTEVHAHLLLQAESKGLGPLDNSAIIRVFESMD